MIQSGPESWRKEVADYEARMFDYFSQCSARLREWYGKGGEESDAYRAEYQRLSDEYQRYINYIQQLREFVAKSDNPPKDSATNQNEQPRLPDGNHTNSVGAPNSLTVAMTSIVSVPISSTTTTAAACYTQYYQEMIAYFEKLLETIELAQQEGNSSSDEEDPTTELDGKVIDEPHDEEELSDPEADTIIGGDLCCNPRAVMEQYFERYGEPGKWDWASWNNYLSWIARTNPQWYGIFLEYSQTLGIDWDEMYKCWRLSDAARQSSESDVGVANPFHGACPVEVSHVRLFNNVPTYGEDDDDDSNEWFCRTCNMQLQTQRAFQLHLRGVSHIQKALGAVQQQHPQHFTGWTNYQPIPAQFTRPPPMPPPLPYFQQQQQQQQHEEQLRHQAWLQSQYWQRNNAEFVVPGTLYCDLCKVNSGTYASLQAHLNGRRHRENVDIYYRTGESSMLKGKRSAHTKPTARLQTLLDTCTQPLVGLGYVVERQFGDEEDCVYLCELCDERITRQTAIKHVCDVAHRVNYMKLHYPDMCAIVVNDQSNRDIRLKRIEAFARKIEDFEGRKRVKVKQLSAFDALRRIWRPLSHEEFDKPKWRHVQQPKTGAALKRKLPAKKMKKLAPPPPSPKPDTKDSSASVNDEQSKTQTTTTNNNTKASSDGGDDDDDDDLEEGEITEESSDENASLDGNSRTVPRSPTRNGPASALLQGNENWQTESGEFEETEGEEADDSDAKNFLPESVLSLEPGVECRTYIETLRSNGFLQLGQSKKSGLQDAQQEPEEDGMNGDDGTEKPKAEEKPSADVPSIEEQFAREAEWVLERARVQREQEEHYRQQVTDAPKSTELDSVPYDMDGGYVAEQEEEEEEEEEDEMWFDNQYPFDSYPIETQFADSVDEFLLPPLGTSFGPAPIQPQDSEKSQVSRLAPPPATTSTTVTTVTNTDAAATTTTASTATLVAPTNSATATMDPGRQQLAVSSGAVQIILSALNALRDAGQLPNYLNTVFEKTDTQETDVVNSVPVSTQPTPAPITSTAGEQQNNEARTTDFVTAAVATTATTIPPLVNTSTTNFTNGTMAPKSSAELGEVNVSDSQGSHPNENTLMDTDLRPPFIPVPTGGPNSSLLGPPGSTIPHKPQAPIPSHPVRPLVSRIPDNPPPNRSIRPPHAIPQPAPSAMDHPREEIRNPSAQSVKSPPGPLPRPPNPVPPTLVRKDGVSDLSSKVASYIRSNPNTSKETMFDAYALFSRRVDERNLSRMQQQQQHAHPPSRFGRRSAGRNTGRNSTSASQSGGRKLSAIADFLGVNEPPPVSKAPSVTTEAQPPAPPPAPPITTSVNSDSTPYLFPVPNFGGTQNSTVPRISVYIPHGSLASSVPNLIPTVPVTPSCVAAPVLVPQSAIPAPVYVPAILPTLSHKSSSSILGAPANLDEFLKKLRTT